jgi:serine/threonine protein phosphatase PrpC
VVLGRVSHQSGPVAALRARGVGITDVGLQRDHNEDTFAVLAEHELFIVADGMGGHRAGDVASRLASESISDFFMRTAGEEVTWPFHFDSGLSESENRLLTAIRLANRQIYEHSLKSHDLRGMGTTVVGALFNPETRKMYVGHVGDSRAYMIRDGQISQLTRDHSLVNDYLKVMPDMPEDQRSELPKNVITRALGMQDSVEVDLLAHDAKLGDTFVLCSDGLSGMISDAEILQVAVQNRDLSAACKCLAALANEHGGEDNITAVVVRIVQSDGASGDGADESGTATEPGPAAAPTRVETQS